MQIEGRNPVHELLLSDKEVKKVILQDGINKNDKITDIIKLARKKNIPIKYAKTGYLNKMTQK